MAQKSENRSRIIDLISQSREASSAALEMLDLQVDSVDSLISKMKMENTIKIIKQDDLTGYRLARPTINELGKKQGHYRNLFEGIIYKTCIRTTPDKRQRYHNQSEILAMMHRLGVITMPGEKPPLYASPFTVEKETASIDLTDALDIPNTADPFTVESQSSPFYYQSTEIKDIGDEGIKIRNARVTGLLRCETGDYFVYNTGDRPMKWEEASEERILYLVGEKLCRNIQPIIVGRTMETALDLLTSDGGKENKYFRVGEHIPGMLYVPYTEEGVFLMRTGIMTDKLGELQKNLKAKINPRPCEFHMTCDGLVGTSALLMALDFDLYRIKKFKMGLEARKLRGIVYCLDFQTDVLKSYFGDMVDIKVIKASQLSEITGIPIGGSRT